ncbi:carboxypeptidase regulatory-like domain-containing protein [Candidatus Woesearchaeota archaeon]|nr:carboxypeptidase regulatory-like domain-containing protein [Candidatus Woesearchaeota archaeon]
MIFSLLFADLAMATGCCVDLQAKSCSTVASQDNCNTGSVLYFDEKSCTTEVSQCALGCCCPPAGTSVGSINISCEPPSTFFPSQVTPGAPCSCSGAGFSVSGSIQSTSGSSISRAFVSAKGVANYSKIDGSFILNNVDGGTNVIVAASKPGCAPSNITIANLASDASNINIQLNCQCTNESCNASANAYCVNSIWKFYDLTVEVHKAEYCNYCGPDDPDDCGSIICIDNNADCPVACSSNPEDINYDSDCVCSSTPNGVCPLGCTADNDADCNVYSPVCGDGIVTYPYETCEDTLAGSGQFSLCSANDCANLGEIGACNCKGISGCGDLVLAPTEACEIGMMCPNGVECEDCMCGPANCTAITMKPVLSSNFDSLSKKINLSWSTHSACAPSISSYSLFRCQKNTTVACSSPTQFNPIDASIPKFTTTYSDGPLSQNSEYCYYLNAYFITDTSKVGASQIKCTSTGNYYCMESHPPQFCMNNARKKCGANNNLETIEDCTPGGKHCMGPNDNGETKCVNQSICDSCNGLFGMFAHLDLNVTVEEGGYRVTKFCKENGRPERDLIEGCYIDRTLSLFNAFDYCANIASCYDYKSEAACTDPADPCAKNKICEWVWLNEDQHALGGLCRPTNPQLHKCEFCDSSQYNWLSPGCTPEVCKLFGSCYYQGTSSLISAQSCSKQSTASCLDYLIQQNCTGGQPVHVDATYNNTIRVGGTHQLAPASSDSLRLGKCYWTGLYCFRDADNNPINFITNTGRDCPIGDRYCEADFSSPTTTILPSGFGVYPATVNIKYTATDNYPSNLINTSFCIVSASNYCYPDELGRNSEYSKKLPVSGSYQIYYYSQDPAKNLEQVKNTTIRVDAEKPFIDLTSPSNASNFPTNLQIVPAQGITSTDSRYVCAKNTRNNQASCINNCVLTGQKQPCFSNDTGIFAISINIGNRTNFTDVLFYAEDFAGNTYSNTLLGILYDIEPPDEPIITIAPNR